MKQITQEQRKSMVRLWTLHSNDGETYLQFRRRFKWTGVGSDNYLFGLVPCGIWIGVELDGHAHS